jgi:putative mRNA 3-end processing factor
VPEPNGLLKSTDAGLYCEAGDFFVDPNTPVDRAVVTHAHGDHARRGSGAYLTSAEGESVLRHRMNEDAVIDTLPYGEPIDLNGVRLSFHPAGHVRGSAQVRLEYDGEVWVVTGDFKVTPDPTCTPFELVPCDVLITECTFGLPIYRWPEPEAVFDQINRWWRKNREEGLTSVLFGYSFGKAQRLLAGVDASIGPIYTHGAVEKMTETYRQDGVDLPATTYVSDENAPDDWSKALVVAPSHAGGSRWMQRFDPVSTGFASGWMRIRGNKRRRSLDRGFVLSDHADWPRLNDVIRDSGAETVYVTHGNNDTFARWLQENGIDAHPLALRSAMDEPDDANDDSDDGSSG